MKRMLQKKTKDLCLFTFSLLFTIASFGQTVDATLLELGFKPDGYPENLTEVENGFYFSVADHQIWFSDGSIEGTNMINDFGINDTGEISQITPVGGLIFFIVEFNSLDTELWVSDGTKEGTIQLTFRNASYSQERVFEMTEYNGKLYFGAYDENAGNELWVSDGTVNGTSVLKDIETGKSGSSPNNFFIFNDQIFFVAGNEEFNAEIWVSDGTENGTQLFKEINPNGNGVNGFQNMFKEHNNHIYFFADNGTAGQELWKSDGTPDGTNLLKEINPGPSDGGLVLIGGTFNQKLVFVANDDVHGVEIWESDGTPEGTKLFIDLFQGSTSGLRFDSQFLFGDNQFFFIAEDENQNEGLWVSNGSSETTRFLKEINSIEADIFSLSPNGDDILFSAYRENTSSEVLWKSDGTTSGTEIISNDVMSSNTSAHDMTSLLYENIMYFSGENDTNGVELWTSDGTNDGTNLFYDFKKSFGSFNPEPTTLLTIGNLAFYRCNDSYLCVTDGTPEGTKRLLIQPEGSFRGGLNSGARFAKFGDKLVFSATDNIHGYELWVSDGTQEGTFMIKDINEGENSSLENPIDLKVINDKIYFAAFTEESGNEPWVSDGTEQGTFLLKDIHISASSTFASSNPRQFTEYNNQVYFGGLDSELGGLYRTDGTVANTTKVLPLLNLLGIKTNNEKLFLNADNEINVSGPGDIFISDGTEEGTSLNFDSSQEIRSSTVLDNSYLFINRTKVYVLNNSSANPIELFNTFNYGNTSVNLKEIISCGDFAYFSVGSDPSASSGFFELWRTDGTIAGTIRIYLTSDNRNSLTNITCLNNNVFFRDSQFRGALWVSNGTLEDTIKLDLNVVNGEQFDDNSPINQVFSGHNKIWFIGATEIHGLELYVTTPSNIKVQNGFSDNDNDGVVDFFDKCPDTDNGLEVNEVGCAENQLDDDDDGVTNDLDLCPETDKGLAVDENGCAENQSPDDDNDGVFNIDDVCPNTPSGESVDEFGCSQSQLDDDQDGVFNNVDICPRTELGVDVDESGCPVEFSLPSNNFQVKITGETCVDKNNGILSIIASNIEYTYLLSLNGSSYEFTEQLEIQNLEAKIYEFCIAILEEPDYEQCYVIDVPEAENITGKSTTSKTGKSFVETITLNSGTAPFTAFINGNRVLSTTSRTFNLEVMPGDEILIKSKFECEGSFNKSIELGSPSFVYPNPTIDFVNILMDTSLEEKLSVYIYDSNQRLLSNKEYLVNNGILELSFKTYPNGIYFIRVKIGNEFNAFKVIKS